MATQALLHLGFPIFMAHASCEFWSLSGITDQVLVVIIGYLSYHVLLTRKWQKSINAYWRPFAMYINMWKQPTVFRGMSISDVFICWSLVCHLKLYLEQFAQFLFFTVKLRSLPLFHCQMISYKSTNSLAITIELHVHFKKIVKVLLY